MLPPKKRMSRQDILFLFVIKHGYPKRAFTIQMTEAESTPQKTNGASGTRAPLPFGCLAMSAAAKSANVTARESVHSFIPSEKPHAQRSLKSPAPTLPFVRGRAAPVIISISKRAAIDETRQCRAYCHEAKQKQPRKTNLSAHRIKSCLFLIVLLLRSEYAAERSVIK